jgi:hypothetical protein
MRFEDPCVKTKYHAFVPADLDPSLHIRMFNKMEPDAEQPVSPVKTLDINIAAL